MKCPLCKQGEIEPENYLDKEKRNEDIKKVEEALKGKSKKEILSKIVEFLRLRKTELSQRQIKRIIALAKPVKRYVSGD